MRNVSACLLVIFVLARMIWFSFPRASYASPSARFLFFSEAFASSLGTEGGRRRLLRARTTMVGVCVWTLFFRGKLNWHRDAPRCVSEKTSAMMFEKSVHVRMLLHNACHGNYCSAACTFSALIIILMADKSQCIHKFHFEIQFSLGTRCTIIASPRLSFSKRLFSLLLLLLFPIFDGFHLACAAHVNNHVSSVELFELIDWWNDSNGHPSTLRQMT